MRTSRSSCWACACLIASALLVAPSAAKSSPVPEFMGEIAAVDGTPLEGEWEVTFELYADVDGKTLLWRERQRLTLHHGHFVVILGKNHPIDVVDLLRHESVFLGISVPSKSRSELIELAWTPGGLRNVVLGS